MMLRFPLLALFIGLLILSSGLALAQAITPDQFELIEELDAICSGGIENCTIQDAQNWLEQKVDVRDQLDSALVNTFDRAVRDAVRAMNQGGGTAQELIDQFRDQVMEDGGLTETIDSVTGQNTVRRTGNGSGGNNSSQPPPENGSGDGQGGGPPCCFGCCAPVVNACQQTCICTSNAETGNEQDPKTTVGHITDEFQKHRGWIVERFWKYSEGDKFGLYPALKMMTSQLSTIGMQQVQIIGSFFDAKHQLETQRQIQVMTAEAHKDYQPSEAMCSIGTFSRGLSASQRTVDLTAAALARRSIDRQMMSGDNVGVDGRITDQRSRLVGFIENFCNPDSNAGNLDYLCQGAIPDPEKVNKDVRFADVLQTPWTLDVNLLDGDVSADETNLFALQDNMIANNLYPPVRQNRFVRRDGTPEYDIAGPALLEARSLVAKRSVAVNSIASIAALKTRDDTGAAPFIYALVKEMGGDDIAIEEIQSLIGENPSYYAQMKVLSKLYYQRPEFFADLYDKPANVERMNVALQATTLMRKRDLYRSYLRSEMTLAVMLETALLPEIELIENEISRGGGL